MRTYGKSDEDNVADAASGISSAAGLLSLAALLSGNVPLSIYLGYVAATAGITSGVINLKKELQKNVLKPSNMTFALADVILSIFSFQNGAIQLKEFTSINVGTAGRAFKFAKYMGGKAGEAQYIVGQAKNIKEINDTLQKKDISDSEKVKIIAELVRTTLTGYVLKKIGDGTSNNPYEKGAPNKEDLLPTAPTDTSSDQSSTKLPPERPLEIPKTPEKLKSSSKPSTSTKTRTSVKPSNSSPKKLDSPDIGTTKEELARSMNPNLRPGESAKQRDKRVGRATRLYRKNFPEKE